MFIHTKFQLLHITNHSLSICCMLKCNFMNSTIQCTAVQHNTKTYNTLFYGSLFIISRAFSCTFPIDSVVGLKQQPLITIIPLISYPFISINLLAYLRPRLLLCKVITYLFTNLIDMCSLPHKRNNLPQLGAPEM